MHMRVVRAFGKAESKLKYLKTVAVAAATQN